MLEEEKDLSLVPDNKGDELTSKIKKELEADPFSSVVENSEVKDSNATTEKVAEEVKTLDNGKEVEEVIRNKRQTSFMANNAGSFGKKG